MSPPIWLPPLNTHDQISCVSVLASQFHRPLNSTLTLHPAFMEPVFVILVRLSVQFYSEDKLNHRAIDGFCQEGTYFTPCSGITDSSIEGKQRILDMFSQLRLPFQLKNIMFRDANHLGEDSEPPFWDDMNSLAEKIQNFLCNSRKDNQEQNINLFPVALEIEKIVQIPDFEHKAWTLWYDEKRRVDPNFESDYLEAISRERTTEELLQEALDISTFQAATKSSIEALEDVRLDEYSSTTSCLICLEDLALGSKNSCLPCSHIFHGDCIIQWLKRSHMCPLCRFKLPRE